MSLNVTLVISVELGYIYRDLLRVGRATREELFPSAFESNERRVTLALHECVYKPDNKETVMLPSERLRLHREEILEILGRYPGLSNVRVIGSVARGEDTEDSDIDFLVDTTSGTTLFDLGGLHEDLVDLLGVPVDIISSKGRMHEHMRMTIERDARAL